MLGWAALILLAGLATLLLLHHFSQLVAPGPWQDLLPALFVILVWPVVILVLRFCVKHWLWQLLGH